MRDALQQNSPTDYTLHAEHRSVWLAIDGLSVYLRRTALDGVIRIEVFRKGYETSNPLTSVTCFDAETE